MKILEEKEMKLYKKQNYLDLFINFTVGVYSIDQNHNLGSHPVPFYNEMSSTNYKTYILQKISFLAKKFKIIKIVNLILRKRGGIPKHQIHF